MFQRRVNHGWHCFGCTSYLQLWCCPNGAVLCKELTLFYKQLGLGTSPQIWFYIQDFQGSKLLNGCLGLAVWPNVFQWIFNLCHWYTVYHWSKIKAIFMKFVEFNWVNRKQLDILKHFWSTWNFIFSLTEDNSALKSCSTNFFPSGSC